MREYAASCWATCEQMHKLMLDDDQPENEKQRLVNLHFYTILVLNKSLIILISVKGS